MTRASELEGVLRELSPQVLSALVRRYGGFDACEDAVQEALLAASLQWPAEGLPDNPKAWLITTASRRRIELWRNESARLRREEAAASLAALTPGTSPAVDDTLTLLLLCSPGADDGLPGRPDAARRRRVDHRRDRPCVRAGGGSGSVQPRPGPQISGCVGWLRGLRCLPLRNRTLSSVAITPRDVMDDLRRYRGQRDPRRRGGQTVPSCQAGTPSLSASPAASRRIVAGPRSRSSGSTLRANRLNRAVSGDSS